MSALLSSPSSSSSERRERKKTLARRFDKKKTQVDQNKSQIALVITAHPGPRIIINRARNHQEDKKNIKDSIFVVVIVFIIIETSSKRLILIP
jgi:hypothetical protein